MYYIDIETVSGFKDFQSADERTQELFKTKFFREIDELCKESGAPENTEAAYLYRDKAAVLAEFNRIVCVSLGTILPKKAQNDGSISPESIYIKSFAGGNEKEILEQLYGALTTAYSLCAHFGKGFDYPILCRKYVMHQIPIPQILNISGKKPWEIPLEDTQDLWKFGDMRHSVSLDLLAHIFGLPSPKTEMHGSEVSNYYYNDPDGINKIAKYCEADVRTLVNVHRKMNYLPILP